MTTALPAGVRSTVWNHWNSIELGQAPCYCCALEMCSQANYECGHVIAKSRGGSDAVPNLRPVCGRCNKSMGTKNMRDFAIAHGLIGRIINETDTPQKPSGNNILEEWDKKFAAHKEDMNKRLHDTNTKLDELIRLFQVLQPQQTQPQ